MSQDDERRAVLRNMITAQQNWINEHGGCVTGYLFKQFPTGELTLADYDQAKTTYDADVVALDRLEQELATLEAKRRSKERHPATPKRKGDGGLRRLFP